MGDLGSENLREGTAMMFDPALNFVVFLCGKIVRVTKNDSTKRRCLAHDDGDVDRKARQVMDKCRSRSKTCLRTTFRSELC